MPISANEALTMALSEQKALNGSRYTPVMDDMVQKVSEENSVYIYNVGPWSHTRTLGSAGTRFIPACPEGREYSDALKIPGLVGEPYPKDETENVIVPLCGVPGQLRGESKGILLAYQIIGEGMQVPPSESLRRFGVFISMTKTPSKADLAKARAALDLQLVAMDAEAREFWQTEQGRKQIQRDWHCKASVMLGKTPAEAPWLGQWTAAAKRAVCENCGTGYEVGIAQCAKCGNVLDEEKFVANERRKAAIMAQVSGGKAKN